jgi:para-aminobenzoate synthetase/4-amino-4-deoxychorismate lyase
VSRPAPGAGIFETVRVEGGHALWLDRHLARLRASAAALYGAAPGDELDASVARALGGAPEQPCRLRITLVPGQAPQAALAPLGPAASRAPVLLRPWTLPGGLGEHKWVDRRLVDAATVRLGATPLIVEPDGEVLEAAWANVWALEGRRLLTPPADGRLLPGVTRSRLLEHAGLDTAEVRLSLERLARADAIVLTSALRLAVPAHLGPESPPDDEIAASMAAALASE